MDDSSATTKPLSIRGVSVKIQAAFALALAIPSGVAGVLVFVNGHVGIGIECLMFFLIFTFVAVRSLLTRVQANARGLEIHRTLAPTLKLGWEDIDTFAYRGWSGGLAARKTNGRWVKLQDFGVLRNRAEQAAALLRAYKS